MPVENWELYDLEQDRTETHNLATAHPALVQQLVGEWEQWITTSPGQEKEAKP
jgi:hypothetical protein